ncbi:uncharacterized protein LOC103312391 [Tribolium castaneum]|uniref:F-box only protein 21-like Protein n=1 Tax=Tribolium castaneum TaxID=7070 RepID=D6WDP0_TRICA|nr:PREDICTED: uncharacterized protein LOC103312391 [Tribolium castaneum]XP_015833632.1 PREDICTED: uncharacterized protein LOC103312391 [Tribolium castaneum]XP_015833633.1 PREDICTED: uncharacterized protein LOC103312391 [Tribolium castaneum]XP_015833634.1 PREDICTED: uncharacterized protein LOC103312391 [Tribolium castaneum]EEZ99944.2 F-box only protein 21-like Protein [Tribolium castaneum]|eukprot:XP_015833631.1 PREDICTED: uncharacterized protein LOC103312391 [Tribolium castaneum]
MDSLSLELLEFILSSPVLSDRDVLNFSSTCHHFRNIVLTSEVIWRRRFYRKLPSFSDNSWCPDSYYEELKYFYSLKPRVLDMLESAFVDFFSESICPKVNLSDWEMLYNEKAPNYFYLRRHLLDINNTKEAINSILIVPFNTPGHLTLQFFARFSLSFLNEIYLKNTWPKFIRAPPKQQIFEKLAILVAQWFHLDTETVELYVTKGLDNFANLVKMRLKATHPKHPIFATQEIKWKKEKLDKHQWEPEDCQVIISTIRDVLYSDLGFQECDHEWEFITRILESRKCLPTNLAVIYESVARRLGVLVDVVCDFSRHKYCFLQLQLNETIYYINPGNGCFMRGVTSSKRVTSGVIVQQMIDNLQHKFLDVNDRDKNELIRSLCRLNDIINNVYISSPLRLLYHQIRKCGNNNKRPIALKYAVGMVVVLNNAISWSTGTPISGKGVIFDWNRSEYEEDYLYGVICDNGEALSLMDYKDALTPTADPGNLQSIEQVALYFSHFFVNHFVPNLEVEKLFPYDGEVRQKFYHQLQARDGRV